MDLDAAFYLQTVDTVFIRHALPKGEMTHRGTPVDPSTIKRTALMTVEGEKDDISGVGQTEAAHTLCSGLPEYQTRVHYVQKGVGHYGVFNGSRFRAEIAPRISDFIADPSSRARHRDARRAVPTPRLLVFRTTNKSVNVRRDNLMAIALIRTLPHGNPIRSMFSSLKPKARDL